jgi:SNW domain-containing protein 1
MSSLFSKLPPAKNLSSANPINSPTVTGSQSSAPSATHAITVARPNLLSSVEQIAVHNAPEGRIVHYQPSSLQAVKDEGQFQRPDLDQQLETVEQTKSALEAILDARKDSTSLQRSQQKEATFIQYTPTGAYAEGKTRLVKIVEAPVDPLAPSQVKNRKPPPRPPSPPAPVLHAPMSRDQEKEAASWKIPPVVSNYQNKKGFVIPLHQRVAADGRRLQGTDVMPNDRFASLSEALAIASKKVQEEKEVLHAEDERRILEEKQKEEEQMRQLGKSLNRGSSSNAGEYDRRRDDKLRRLDARDDHRDASERAALGRQKMDASEADADSLIDGRLIERATASAKLGFGDDESYNVYDSKFMPSASDSKLYKANVSETLYAGLKRNRPVAFEDRETAELRAGASRTRSGDTGDLFGIDEITKGAPKTAADESRRGNGLMHVAAGGSRLRDDDEMPSRKRSRIEFEPASRK